jgi:hypothetical protein
MVGQAFGEIPSPAVCAPTMPPCAILPYALVSLSGRHVKRFVESAV